MSANSVLGRVGLLFFSLAQVAAGETILYVDGNASGPTHNGSSWCNAYLELQPALSVAADGATIRVADAV